MFTSVTDSIGVKGTAPRAAVSRSVTSAPRGGTARETLGRISRRYILVSLLTASAGHIYEHYSHGVYSRAMFWAFLIPLFAGAALFGALSLTGLKTAPDKYGLMFWHWSVAAFTVGSLFKGALDIYGTGSPLVAVYWAAGGALAALGLLRCLGSRAGGAL